MATLEYEPTETECERASSRAAGAAARARLLARLPAVERSVTAAGIRTAVLQGGEGPPIVLLHGPGGYGAHWSRVIPALVGDHRVIAPDLPGHGESSAGAGGCDADRVLRWLDDLIEQTCASAPVLVGQLLGGAIAARFAIRRPERLRSLVLVDTFGLGPLEPAPEFSLALSRFQTEPNERTHDELWQLCARDLPVLRAEMGELWAPFAAYNLDLAQVPELRTAQRDLMAEFGLRAISGRDLARIAVPTALIWGRHDLATPLAVAEHASAEYGWPLFVIDGANDDPAIEQPEAFLRALGRALGKGANDRGGRP